MVSWTGWIFSFTGFSCFWKVNEWFQVIPNCLGFRHWIWSTAVRTFTFSFVENFKPFFPCSEKCTLYHFQNVENWHCTYTLWKISQVGFHIVDIINVSSTKSSTLLIIWNIFSTFLQLNQKIYANFHKSFRNLPNFFR